MAALRLPTYPNPHDRNSPLENAYAYFGELTVNFRNDTSQAVLHVHPNEAAWQDQPVGYLGMQGGDMWEGGAYFPRISEFMQDPEFAAAFTVIATKIYAKALLNPALAGATPYPPPA